MCECPKPRAHSAASRLVVLSIVVGSLTLLLKWVTDVLYRLDIESRNMMSALFFEDALRLKKIPLPSIHAAASKTLSVVFPAYNEETRLPSALDEALAFLQEKRKRQGVSFSYEVIIVDDGSVDKTYEVAMSYVSRYGLDTVRVLRLPINRGKGHAVKSGTLAARGQLLLFADADGATQFSDLDRLEESITKIASSSTNVDNSTSRSNIGDRHAMVVGSRSNLEKTDAVAKRHWTRNFLMHGFHFLVLCVAGSGIRDTQCGFKMVTRRSGRLLYSNMRLRRWCFDVELVYLAKRLGIPVAEVCVNWTEVQGSKLRFYSIASMATELLLIKLGYTTGVWQLNTEASLPVA